MVSNPGVYDVVVVGYGPVGRLLALRLGRRGHNVLVVEKQRSMYFLPRAVHIDDEACRILQAVGAGPADAPAAIAPYDDFYEWRNARHDTILRLDWRGRGPSGWNVSNFINQPMLERHLHALVESEPTVRVVYGETVVSVQDHGEWVELAVQDGEGAERTVRASYVVGADGARSLVRGWIGGTSTDLGYFHDWLVVDLVMKTDDIEFTPPAWQLCDPKRPTTLVPGGPGRRRFEFMRLPNETAEELSTEAAAWRLLEPWGVGPTEATLERNTVYTFQASWADDWSRGRVFIAGDAAHLMPPFAGQGMCAGLRDVMNLEWKLSLVLRGLASAELLHTYGPERKEHVRHFIASSMALGEVICITDENAAADRDAAMRSDYLAGVEQPARPLPRLGAGASDQSAAAGLLSIQTPVTYDGRTGLFDTIVHHDGVLLISGVNDAVDIGDAQRDALRERGIRIVTVGASGSAVDVIDIDGNLQAWMADLDAVAVLVRPDFYVYGGARTKDEIGELVDRFLATCGASVAA
ncbi:MAG TPA: bifunctional 3-(3-hydroxy-phenyl)propionate/3-hydroxycinnamic acid hydroxylase [Microbacterium sp.]|uniref:bifunctional 3-(3-hydroxy-phenyl)propionate/3-hydroxycinnamic acid hydroxylase MhpA n=1 Tax=Microbacterium sp. TaxID=51671 RepID=UPI002CFF809A|nr:bifunctional 3-(3-hydroxy-phenyl)propionate/3-hydroxycinnamic acid hydroxylase [Microbacterium sp.]HWI31833.1 bifunctional 3-(3-hydroxy-phenyl)propionate/3-hydroxycinnamic acid hydroxylase [Microbacterium sp.]